VQSAFILNPMNVHMTDSHLGCASVHFVTQTQERGTTSAVNLSDKACTCGLYQQTGIPCIHAWAVLMELSISDNCLFTEKYFHAHCFTAPLKSMFTTVPSFIGCVPSTFAVEDRLHRQVFQTVRARLVVDSTSSRSTKRITSSGEASGKSTISAKAFSKSRIQCGICLETFAKRTIHPPSACAKVCSRKGITYPERRKCPELENIIDDTMDANCTLDDYHGDDTRQVSVDDMECDEVRI
jgi:hypothetical protein